MKNPIPTSKLFATPKSEQDLFKRIEALTGPERALAYQIAMMTMNMCSSMVDRAIACQELVDPMEG